MDQAWFVCISQESNLYISDFKTAYRNEILGSTSVKQRATFQRISLITEGRGAVPPLLLGQDLRTGHISNRTRALQSPRGVPDTHPLLRMTMTSAVVTIKHDAGHLSPEDPLGPRHYPGFFTYTLSSPYNNPTKVSSRSGGRQR